MSNLSEIDRIRTITATVVERANTDEAFRAELQADPARVLREAGLPDRAADQVAHDEWTNPQEEVGGYMKCLVTCDHLSCWSSNCAIWPLVTHAV